MNDHGVSTKISYHAGAFVCNSTFYNLLHKIKNDNLSTEGLFIHVPIIPSQVSNYDKEYASMELSEITKAFYTAIEYLTKK